LGAEKDGNGQQCENKIGKKIDYERMVSPCSQLFLEDIGKRIGYYSKKYGRKYK
jgi:hypothetical protein